MDKSNSQVSGDVSERLFNKGLRSVFLVAGLFGIFVLFLPGVWDVIWSEENRHSNLVNSPPKRSQS
jgi:hypothetical protein